MHIEWDQAKRQANLVSHRLDFVDADKVFDGATFTFFDDRFAYDEDRYITLGMLNGITVVLAHTEREGKVRLISMRKATRREEEIYFASFGN